MAKLTLAQKYYVATALGCCHSPSAVAQMFRDEFGVTITRQQVYEYDPSRAGRPPAPRWVKVHAEARAEFLRKHLSEIPTAHKAVRVRRLERIADRAEERGNLKLAMAALEQVAREVSGWYRRTTKITGDKDAWPVRFMLDVPPLLPGGDDDTNDEGVANG